MSRSRSLLKNMIDDEGLQRCEEREEEVLPLEWQKALHRLWSKATNNPDYVKSQWDGIGSHRDPMRSKNEAW